MDNQTEKKNPGPKNPVERRNRRDEVYSLYFEKCLPAVQILARKIIENYSESAGKDPHGVAGAALYLAASIKGKKVTQSQISRASGVTEATIRKNLKFLEKDFSNLKKIGE